MSTTITLTEVQADTLRQVLVMLVSSSGYGKSLMFSKEQYTALYYSGESSRKLGRLYGKNEHHFNRVWKRMGLDTALMPSSRKKYAPQQEEKHE